MKLTKQHTYIPVLGIALSLFIYALSAGAPSQAYLQTRSLVASVSVGASASVDPNQFNTLAQQLGDKEKELAAREKALGARDATQAITNSAAGSLLPMISFVMSLILALLVGVNFYFDWRRAHRTYAGTTVVPVINLRSRG